MAIFPVVALTLTVASSRADPSTASQVAATAAVAAVKHWYAVLDDASGSKAQYGGSIGAGQEPLRRAYAMLGPAAKTKITSKQFVDSYVSVAHVALLQAHALSTSSDGATQVWVEEKRASVIDSIPAVSWYAGPITLSRDGRQWLISRIDLQPEDFISVNYGGHQPWRLDPRQVAAAAVAVIVPDQFTGVRDTSSMTGAPVSDPSDPGVRIVTVSVRKIYTVRVVKMASGLWFALSVKPKS